MAGPVRCAAGHHKTARPGDFVSASAMMSLRRSMQFRDDIVTASWQDPLLYQQKRILASTGSVSASVFVAEHKAHDTKICAGAGHDESIRRSLRPAPAPA
ncbi:hypothetical protein [Roseomonas sp. 18066]|uniref:hypothetical protein n=1 Tax=Roseomonas sp. 18066 TaxID=2681412 RepID=UPI00135CE0B5|nr:hypothetical protein [Roseomonas sp. 18066]